MVTTKSASAVLFITLIPLLNLFVLHAASAEPLPRAVLIIDGSGSMWGRIDKREKIVIAREQLAKQIETLQGKVDLGVMSYGHRRRRDCRDIEMIVPISPISLQSHGRAIKRLLPRGKTPVASSLQMAADALIATKDKFSTDRKSHIILVADGTENCRQDPCATAASLVTKIPSLTIDVIGFGINTGDIEQLQCIAKTANGVFRKADNSKQLETVIGQIFARRGAMSRLTGKPPKMEKKEPAGLYLSAGFAKDAAPLDKNLSWRVYRAGESSKSGASPLHRHVSPTPFLNLPKGLYHIEVRYQSLFAEQDIDVQAKKAAKAHLSFNVGVVTASAQLEKSSPLLHEAIFSLYDASSGPTGPRNIIEHKQEKKATFYLPPGKYKLKVRANKTLAQRAFTVKAGEQKKISMLLDAGRITLAAYLAKSMAAISDVQFAVYKRGKNKDIEFIRTLDPNPQLILPAGEYFVLARKGSASSYRKLTVSAGESKSYSLILNAGILQLSSNLVDQKREQPALIAYTITPVKPISPKTIKLSADSTLVETDQSLPIRSFRNSFVLPKGEYFVHALFGNSNAEATVRVQVKAGQERLHKISMSAGRINLSLVLSSGNPPLPGVFWSILDRTGKQVASASGLSPVLTLSKGNYIAVADYLGQSYRRELVLSNGDNKSIQLQLQ